MYHKMVPQISDLVYVHMYAAYDTRRPICDGEFLSDLPSVRTHVCGLRHPMADLR